MSNAKQETIADIVAAMRDEGHAGDSSCLEWVGAKIRDYADRIEAAERRRADSIHRAMVIIAGIEMEDSENPPRLWTALEDAYDALSDALGTDGETTADMEEAKATGRSFVVKPYGNADKMRDACANIAEYAKAASCHTDDSHLLGYLYQIERLAESAISAPPRNCDRPECATTKAAQDVWRKEDGGKTAFYEWLLATYTEGGTTDGKKH